MAKFEFEYTEIDGLLYPNIEIDGKVEFDSLGKYGRFRLSYLYAGKPDMYRELFLTASWQSIVQKLERLPLKHQSVFACPSKHRKLQTSAWFLTSFANSLKCPADFSAGHFQSVHS
jgi:hypothetical protein